MRLHRLVLRDYRGVSTRELVLPETGVTIVLGDNETGKSSLLEAFDLLLSLPADSKHSRLRDVRPVGRDVGTEVEAEFGLGPLRLSYRKRWFTDRLTELAVHEPDGRVRTYTGREAHDQAARLFGEHVDPTLWRALVVGQEDTLAIPAPREVGAVLAALDEAVRGDEALAAQPASSVPLVEAVESEYRRYFTARGRPTDEYARAQAEVDRLRAEVETAERRAREVEDDVRRAERLAQDCERFRTRLAEADAEVTRLRRARSDASELIGAVERLRDQAALAAERLNTARADRARRVGLVEEVAQRSEAVAAATSLAVEAATTLEAADRELSDAATALRAAREAASAARAAAGRTEARLSRLRDQADLEALDARLASVEQALTEERSARLELERNVVDGEVADRVERVHRDLLAARAAVEASAPRLVVRRLGDRPVTVDGAVVDGQDADEAVEHVVERDTVVAVEGVVEVVVRAGGHAAGSSAELAAAVHAEQQVLDELGLADVDAVRAAARARAEAERRLAGAQETVARRLDGESVADLRARRDLLATRLADTADPLDDESLDGLDVDAVRDRLERARSDEAAAASALEAAEHVEALARKEFEAARETATTARVRVEQETERLEEAERALADARSERSDEAVDAAVDAATAAAESLLAEHRAAVDALAAAGIADLTAQLDQAVRVRDELQRHLERDTGDLRQVEGRLEMAGAQGIASALERARADLAAAERRLQILDRRARAAARLRTTLEHHREQAHRRYAEPLRQRLESLGRLALGPTFGVVLDDDLRVVARTLHGVQVPVGALSTGAREQLATMTRLAIAGLTAADGKGVPVILDDALGWSDPARLRAMGELLARAGESGQVLLLTCVPDRYAFVAGAHVVRV